MAVSFTLTTYSLSNSLHTHTHTVISKHYIKESFLYTLTCTHNYYYNYYLSLSFALSSLAFQHTKQLIPYLVSVINKQ